MNFSELQILGEKLQANPPSFAVSPARELLLRQIDVLFGEADSEYSAALSKFYSARVDKILDEAAAYSGDTPRMWKFYSSGFIIKAAGKTIAHDINDGCTPPHGRSLLQLKSAQIRKLADLIDEYYNTHSHRDHISAALCDALADRKKLLVMTAQARHAWHIPAALPAETLDLPHVKTYLNWQGNASGGLDCAMYLITLANGKNVFVRGDIFHEEGFMGCMDFLDKNALVPDYCFTSHYSTSGPEPIPFMAEKFPACRFIPIHEWEFSHRPTGKPGPATQCFAELMQVYDFLYRQNRAQYLTWGESIALD